VVAPCRSCVLIALFVTYSPPRSGARALVGDRHRPAWTPSCASSAACPADAVEGRRRLSTRYACSTRPDDYPRQQSQATEFIPLAGVDQRDLADAAQLSRLSDETPEGRSIVVLAKGKIRSAPRDGAAQRPFHSHSRPQTRMSGSIVRVSHPQTERRGNKQINNPPSKSPFFFLFHRLCEGENAPPPDLAPIVEKISKSGGTPLDAPRDGASSASSILYKDIVKGGIRDRFAEPASDGHPHVMITGDNPPDSGSQRGRTSPESMIPRASDPEDKAQAHQNEGRAARASSSPCAATEQ